MVKGIGVDIVEIQRLQRIRERFGERFAQRLLSETEFAQFEQRRHSIKFLASRFAAKEAASKALGTGMAQGISFKSIEVVNDELGKPSLQFHDAAQERLEQLQASNVQLSLSDEQHYAVAMVVIESS